MCVCVCVCVCVRVLFQNQTHNTTIDKHKLDDKDKTDSELEEWVTRVQECFRLQNEVSPKSRRTTQGNQPLQSNSPQTNTDAGRGRCLTRLSSCSCALRARRGSDADDVSACAYAGWRRQIKATPSGRCRPFIRHRDSARDDTPPHEHTRASSSPDTLCATQPVPQLKSGESLRIFRATSFCCTKKSVTSAFL